MDLATTTTFFGWVTVINLSIYVISVLSLILFRPAILRLHVGIFEISEPRVREIWYGWLGAYKLMIIALNVAPYLALRLIA